MPKMELTGRLITLLVENKDRVQSISGIIYTAIRFLLSKFKMNFRKITEIFKIREYIGIQTTQLKCL
jgi:predicted mannosyl-3-phosphoglycerate phosphatase (HAD superfamily)